MRKISIIESLLRGKVNDNVLCEDAIFIGNRFVAVIDGVTSKRKLTYKGKTMGKYASEVLIKKFEKLEREKSKVVTDPEQLLNLLDRALNEFIGKFAQLSLEDYPRASIIFCDLDSMVVVSYGDCKCKIGDVVIENEKKIDYVLSNKRSKILVDCLSNGENIEKLRNNDLGRKAIRSELSKQYIYENKSECYFGYPVLNGCGINKNMIKVYDVKYGIPIILCSDGYPLIRDTLRESEEILNMILKADPLLIGENSFGYNTTKGLEKGAISFDDRAWIKFIVTDEAL